MATNARIIFRGLTAFIWENGTGRLAAVLVDTPRAAGAPNAHHHVHVPRLSWIGHRAPVGGRSRRAYSRVPTGFKGTMQFTWAGNGNVPVGVTQGADFTEFVPSYNQLGASPNTALRDPDLFTFRRQRDIENAVVPALPIGGIVHCDAGQIEVSDLVPFWRSPDRIGPTSPKFRQPVEFLGVGNAGGRKGTWQMGLASECTLRVTHPDDNARLTISTADSGDLITLESLTAGASRPVRGHPARHDVTDTDIEILITNFSARMDAPLPFSAHYQAFFDLHQNPPSAPTNACNAQVTTFRNRCAGNPGMNWGDAMAAAVAALYSGQVRYPFPYMPDPRDVSGNAIMDWDDREMCPFIWGGDA